MRKLHPELSSHKLSKCGEFYGIYIDEEDLHYALVNTRLTAKVLLAQTSELSDKNIPTFEEMLNFLS